MSGKGTILFPAREDRRDPGTLSLPWESPTKVLRNRLRLFQIVVLVLFGIVVFRLARVQIIDTQKYREMAQKQYQARIILPAARGILYDRNGTVIASNAMYVSFAADPQLAAEDAKAIAATFSRVFGKPRSHYLDKLRNQPEDCRFVWLERQVDTGYLKKINPSRLEGVVVRYEPKRLYFENFVAGQLVGTTDIDNHGLAGAEKEYNARLEGTNGYVVLQRDGKGVARPTVDYPRVNPKRGLDVTLTIDMKLQAIAEKELRAGVEQNHADGGVAILLMPTTGEILAMAQCPSIDPNSFNKAGLQDQKLRAVTDLFEPGSVFKVVTVSAAIEHGLIPPGQRFFAENGTWNVEYSPGKFRKISDTHKEGWLTFQEALEKSSNIVMAKASNIIGGERLYTMARDYGFGVPTRLGFPGEAAGVLKKPVEWSGTTLNTMAYGYEVGVTPIQIAAAYAALANGGVLMKPYLLKQEVDDSGRVVNASTPQSLRRVVSPQTARTLRDFFTGVVERGTGTPAKIPGVAVAGKTGTSRKYNGGHYEEGSYTASFVGFLPAEDPRLVCLVMIDHPRGTSYYGGTVSAPVFKAIAEKAMTASDLFAPALPSARPDSGTDRNPPGRSMRMDTGVDNQRPSLRGVVAGIVPDVRGWTVRKAVGFLASGKFEPVVNGSGIVIGQTPAAGQPARAGARVLLICQPKTVTAALNRN